MNIFETQDEQEAFEAESTKPTTGDRKQDVRDIWFAARDFFSKPAAASSPDPHRTQVFELTSEAERAEMYEWALQLDNAGEILSGTEDDMPRVSVGDILVRRPSGFYEVFRSFNVLAQEKRESATARDGEYRRMEILRVLGHATTEKLQEIDNWVSGGRSA